MGTGGVITYIDSYLCDWNCVCIGRKGTINKPIYMDSPFWSVDTLFYTKPKENSNAKFLYYVFETINWLNYNEASGVPSLSSSTIMNIEKYIPSVIEQQNIVLLLSTLDNRIEKQGHLIASLKKYKRGLLSGVFSETVNNIEYDTTACLFSEIASRRKEKYNPASGICFPCVELEHLEQETGRILGSVPSDQQNSIKTVCKVGDTMFGKLRPYLRKYAYANNDLVCSSEIWSLVPSDIVVPKYLFYLVQTEQFIRAANISSGTKMPRAEWTSVEKSVFNIPPKNTQEKIVSLFEGIDKKLDNAQATMIMLENYKLGLLQQLFI